MTDNNKEAIGKDMKELRAKRASVKGRLTSFKNYLDSLKNMDVSKQQVNELKTRLKKIEGLFVEYDSIQTTIEIAENLDEIPEEISSPDREKIEPIFYEMISRAQELIETQARRFSVVGRSDDSVSSGGSNFNVKLPTIKLPNFDGEYSKWLEYRDTFKSIIHENDGLSEVTKFQYLKASLTGKAALVIESLQISSDNYAVAWDMMCERFDNKRQLIRNHLLSLFSAAVLTNESAQSLRHLIDHISSNLRALNSLGESTTNWDTLIIFTFSARLGSMTITKWEEHKNSLADSPKLDQFYEFLRGRANVLEMVSQATSSDAPPPGLPASDKSGNQQSVGTYKRIDSAQKSFVAAACETTNNTNLAQITVSNNKCRVCNGDDHSIYFCEKFNSMSQDEKNEIVTTQRLCVNCLKRGHFAYQCRARTCTFCGKRHNTLLHRGSENGHVEEKTTLSNPIALTTGTSSGEVLLSTAIIKLQNKKSNEVHLVRCLLDCGSQSSFMTESLQKRLELDYNDNFESISVSGINGISFDAVKSCTATVQSCASTFGIDVTAIIIPQITKNLPTQEIDVSELNVPHNVTLADPKYYCPAEVDLLLGGDVFWDVICQEKIKMGENRPILQNSLFGWLVVGPAMCTDLPVRRSVRCNFSQEVRQQLSRFWELDEPPAAAAACAPLSAEEEAAEQHFTDNTRRLDNGRFCVTLPLRYSPDILGSSYHTARKRFESLERRFKRQPDVKIQYVEFLREYAELWHLSEVQHPENANYLPHHPVLKEESESTKCRVVFDASAKTSSGHSFNDILMTGPTIQDDIFSILARFRKHSYVLTGDIEKMYRQVEVDASQRNLQMILWREDEGSQLKSYQLNTVTYGTSAAPFLSTRCLKQLGLDVSDPLIRDVILHDFYVDDLSTGHDDQETLKSIYQRVTETLESACFNLRKIKSNSESLVQDVSDVRIVFGKQDNLKLSTVNNILGIEWDPNSDNILMSLNKLCNFEKNVKFTKRMILSLASSIYDPLGLVCLCVIVCKMILQSLWLEKLDWDDFVPQSINEKWRKFISNVHHLSNLRVPRHAACNNPVEIELHTFSDASLKAYAACIYMRSRDVLGNYTVRLFCAKARVAPLKATTIPRLELCGALTAARLCDKVSKALRCTISRKYFWSDSQIVLGWLCTPSHKLATFVSHRVAEVNELCQGSAWLYVPSAQNPADLASRGLYPDAVETETLWWEGPTFLKEQENQWPSQVSAICAELPELRAHIACIDETPTLADVIDFSKHSSFQRLRRIFAYVGRFIQNCRSKVKCKDSLTVNELETSEWRLAYIAQQQSFPNFHEGTRFHKRLSNLTPFVDKMGMIRVGGRLDNSSGSYDKRHPIILNAKHAFTKLVFVYYHVKFMHAAPQLLLSVIREHYWPIRGRTLARRVYNDCMRCKRLRGAVVQQLMGNLPSQRIEPGSCFEITGTDFAGPIYINDRKGRGSKLVKAYICVFVCLKVKAVHLELVSDLSTEAFILSLRRMFSRRGKCHELFCDNGTNYVGANRAIGQFLEDSCSSVSAYCAEEGIRFKFSPAYSPNFGGLNEAAVKSAKYHIKRVLGNTHMTFEEFTTLLCQVEAILNSRPLCPLSSNPDDLSPLTPGHFLIGRPLTSLPAPDLQKANPHRLHRYARIEQARQHFWTRWTRDYLCELQQRTKWQKREPELKIGQLVMIKEETTSPLKWPLGRIQTLYPGTDGASRVADVRTSKGTVKRAISRVCPLLDLDN